MTSPRPLNKDIPPVPRVRSALADLPTYKAGQAPRAATGSGKETQSHKLSSNENPWGPVPAAQAALSSITGLHLYPEPFAQSLCHRIQREFGFPEGSVITGTGSLGVLNQLFQALAGTNEDGVQDEVVYAWRSFEAYPISATLAGARSVQVPLAPGARHDLPAMAEAITERTRAVIICSPNNPTGTAVGLGEFEDFMSRVPPGVAVVLDEAYVEFVRNPQAVRGEEVFPRHPNLVLLRTFSKAYGLAALRVGYAVAHPLFADQLRKTTVPFGVSAAASAAALVSLDHRDLVLRNADALVAERTRVREEANVLLERSGLSVPSSEGNFIWIPFGADSQEFARWCAQRHVAVRPFGQDGVRVSVGAPGANDAFLGLLKEFLLEPAAPA